MVWSCDADGSCDYLSPQWVAYTGIPAEPQLGSAWLERVHPEDRVRVAATWAHAVATLSKPDIEYRLRRHDGAYRWFKTVAIPDIDTNGNIQRWYGSNTDIQDLRDSRERLAELNEALEIRVQSEMNAAIAAATHLRRTSEMLELAQSITHTGSFSYDIASDTVTWSGELFRILQVPLAEIAPPFHTHHTFYTPASWATLVEVVALARTEGIPYEVELELAPTAGASRFAIARGLAERDDTGTVFRLFGTLQDVTELVQERLERTRLAERLVLATSGAGTGVCDRTMATEAMVWNDQMYELHGVPIGTQPTYEIWRQALHPDDRVAADAAVRDGIAGAPTFTSTSRVTHPVKGERHVRSTSRVFLDALGQPVRLISVSWDVTAEVIAERRSAENTNQLRAFIRKAPAAIAMLDRDVCYIEASEQWMTDYGLVREQVIGRRHVDVFPHQPAHWPELHERTLAGEVLRNDAEAFPQPDGRVLWLQWETRPWEEPSGAIGGLLFFTRDITQQVQLQHSIQAQATELARSNEDLQQFAFAASHDLQEPLRAMAGCAQILESEYRGRLDADADELIEHMVDGAKRMQQLIEDLLSFSRVGTHGDAFGTVSLRTALADALRNVQQAVEESGAEVTVDQLPTITADQFQLTQLFQNLVGNAIKYRSATAPRVSVRAERRDGLWEIAVRDNGIGIPVEARERVFQIFQRLHTRTDYPGTGVGLALCRRIVERHGGRIWIAPTDGAGTEFRFTLPERAL